MALVHNDRKYRRENIRHKINNSSKVRQSAGKNKNTWVPEHKRLYGSLQEGLGFAFKRKEKVKHEYNKLCRKQRKNKRQETCLVDKYPEHLEHLYLAEEQRQRKEELQRRLSRTGERTDSVGKEEEKDGHDFCPGEAEILTAADQTNTVHTPSPTASAPQPNRRQKMTSYKRTKEDYKRQQEERERRNEAYKKYAAEKEEALQKYKEKKKATYHLLKKRTKKGQPNLNAQMELLLQKIQATKK